MLCTLDPSTGGFFSKTAKQEALPGAILTRASQRQVLETVAAVAARVDLTQMLVDKRVDQVRIHGVAVVGLYLCRLPFTQNLRDRERVGE